jgi:hypothetical protein
MVDPGLDKELAGKISFAQDKPWSHGGAEQVCIVSCMG